MKDWKLLIRNSWQSDVTGVDCLEWYDNKGSYHWDTYHNFVEKYGHQYDDIIKDLYNKEK